MKFKKILVSTLAIAILSGCTNSPKEEEQKDVSSSKEVVTENKKEDVKETKNEELTGEYYDDFIDPNNIGKTIKNDDIEYKILKAGYVDNEITSGPIKINIFGVSAGILNPRSQEVKDFYQGGENIQEVIIYADIENTEDEEIRFYFGQSKMTTDTKEQLDPELYIMPDDGEYLGKVVKEVRVLYYPETNLEDINEMTLHAKAPFSKESTKIGEDVKIKITFDDDGKVKSIE